MANWDKHKPKGMSREELERRIADGRKRWIAKGWIPADFDKPTGRIVAEADGPHLDKRGRQRVIECSNLAIYALANGDRQDYVYAVKVMNATRNLAGLSVLFMKAICEGIAEAAAVASGRAFSELDMVARTWLDQEKRLGARLISVPVPVPTSEGDSDGQGQTEGGQGRSEGGGEGLDQQAPGEGDQPELQPGEERGGVGGAGGPVGEDPAGAGGPGRPDQLQD